VLQAVSQGHILDFILNSFITMSVKYLQIREGVYQYVRRVPNELRDKYPSGTIRISLNTKDQAEAVRKLSKLNKGYELEFDALRRNGDMSPSQVAAAAQALARQYENNLDMFVDILVDPLLSRYREKYPESDPDPSPQTLLNPVQYEAWRLISKGSELRFSFEDAFKLYLQNHLKKDDPRFSEMATRNAYDFIGLMGNLQFDEIKRDHVREYVRKKLEGGSSTGTVRRKLNTLSAICETAIKERQIVMVSPFRGVPIPNLGKDAKKPNMLGVDKLRELMREFSSDTSPTALMILLQAELGTRIAEVSGLAKEDIKLTHEIPHVVITEKPWRSLKTKESERSVPLVGLALEAAKVALSAYPESDVLFPQYKKPRGGDAASAAVNKRLKAYGITSHSFRHMMKDRLREAGCPPDVRDAIQGQSTSNVAETYGLGHSLRTMKSWLDKVVITL
jgi:integrase